MSGQAFAWPDYISANADTSSVLAKGRAICRAITDIEDMSGQAGKLDLEAVRARLSSAVDASGMSMRQVSLRSNNAAGYVHAIINDGKEPRLTNLAAVCDALNVSLLWVLYGIDASPETEEILRRLEQNPTKRASILGLLGE